MDLITLAGEWIAKWWPYLLTGCGMILGAIGWLLYIWARSAWPTLVKEAAEAARKKGKKQGQEEAAGLRGQLEAQRTAAATDLETAKEEHDDALGAVSDELTKSDAEVKRLLSVCSFQPDWPRAHFDGARQRPLAFCYEQLLRDGLEGDHPWVRKTGDALGVPTGQDPGRLSASTEAEAIAAGAGLAEARRELDGVDDSAEWQVILKHLWQQFERKALSDRRGKGRSVQFKRGRGKSGKSGDGAPKPQPDENPPAAPAPGD